MKLVLFLMIASAGTWAKPTVLVSYFDAFGRAKVNNSETVAKLLLAKTRGMGLPFEIKLCRVQTKFDVSLEELRDCVSSLKERPSLVIGLGETGCKMKPELMGRNLDKTKGPDNAGVERRNTVIVPGAPAAVGLTYPLAEMYCALSSEVRRDLIVSNNAGSFVCNNLAFQTAWFESDLSFGFIHVPSHTCSGLSQLNEKAAEALLTMINRGLELSLERITPVKLPVTKNELEAIRARSMRNECLTEFWKRAQPFEDKRIRIF